MDLEEIYRKHFHDIFLYVKKLSGDEHVAEEITSDTFLKAMKSIHSFRGDCDIRVWLCQIAKNSFLSYVKKHKNISFADIPTQDLVDSKTNIDEDTIVKDQAMRIKTILHSINDPYREVFMWRVFAELSFKQIGQIFHKSENWACVVYHRCKAMIRKKLEEQEYEK